MSYRYEEIAIQLRNRILNGDYSFGEKIPGEYRLMAEFDVSRVTIRRALQELTEDGLVHRRRRRGTVAVCRAPAAPLRLSAHGMLEVALRIGLRTGITMKSFGFVPASETVAEYLGIEKEAPVQNAVRVRTLDGTPFSHVTTFVPERIGRNISRADLSRHPMLVLFERAGIKIGRAEQTVKAVAADAETASDLEVKTGTPLLSMSRVVFDPRDKPIQYLAVLYPPDRYEYKMTLMNASRM
jgi:GntR family transcriptional regulator